MTRNAHRFTYPTAREVARATTLSGSVRTRYHLSLAVEPILHTSFSSSAFWRASQKTTYNRAWCDSETSARGEDKSQHSAVDCIEMVRIFPPYRRGASLCNKSSINSNTCLLYTSDAADDLLCVDLGGR